MYALCRFGIKADKVNALLLSKWCLVSAQNLNNIKQNVIYSVCKSSVFKEASELYILQLYSFSNQKSYMHQHKPNLWCIFRAFLWNFL